MDVSDKIVIANKKKIQKWENLESKQILHESPSKRLFRNEIHSWL